MTSDSHHHQPKKWVLDTVDRCWNCWATDHQQNCPYTRLSIGESEDRRNSMNIGFPMRDPRAYIKVIYPVIGCYNCWQSIDHRSPECTKPQKTDAEREGVRKQMGMPCFPSWKDKMNARGIIPEDVGGRYNSQGLEACLKMVVRMTKASGGGVGDHWVEELIRENAGLAGIPPMNSGVPGGGMVTAGENRNNNATGLTSQSAGEQKHLEPLALKEAPKANEDGVSGIHVVTSEYLKLVGTMMPAAAVPANPSAQPPKKAPVSVNLKFSDLAWDGDFGVASQGSSRRGALLNQPVSSFKQIEKTAEHLCWNCWEEHPRQDCPDTTRSFQDSDILRRNKRIARPVNAAYDESLAAMVCTNCWRTTHHDRNHCDKPAMKVAIRETIRCSLGIPMSKLWAATLRSSNIPVARFRQIKDWDRDIKVGGKTDAERIKEDAEAAAALEREKEEKAAAAASAAAAAARRAAEPARRKYLHYLPLPNEGGHEEASAANAKPTESIHIPQPIKTVTTAPIPPKSTEKAINFDDDSDSDPNPGEFVARPIHHTTEKNNQQQQRATQVKPTEGDLIDLSIPAMQPTNSNLPINLQGKVVAPAPAPAPPKPKPKPKPTADGAASKGATAKFGTVSRRVEQSQTSKVPRATLPASSCQSNRSNTPGKVEPQIKPLVDVGTSSKPKEQTPPTGISDLGSNKLDKSSAPKPTSINPKLDDRDKDIPLEIAGNVALPLNPPPVIDMEHFTDIELDESDDEDLTRAAMMLMNAFNEFKAFRRDLSAMFSTVASAMQTLVDSQVSTHSGGEIQQDSVSNFVQEDAPDTNKVKAKEVEAEAEDEFEINYNPSDFKRNAPLTGRVRKGYPFYMNVYQN